MHSGPAKLNKSNKKATGVRRLSGQINQTMDWVKGKLAVQVYVWSRDKNYVSQYLQTKNNKAFPCDTLFQQDWVNTNQLQDQY